MENSQKQRRIKNKKINNKKNTILRPKKQGQNTKLDKCQK